MIDVGTAAFEESYPHYLVLIGFEAQIRLVSWTPTAARPWHEVPFFTFFV